MKASDRARLLKTHGRLYRKHIAEGVRWSECFYCGDTPDSVDHCPPLSWVDSRRQEDWRESGVPLVLVPSCTACNRGLGDRPMFTVLDRLLYLEKVTANKLDRELTLWSEEELAEMSPEFQRVLRARKAGTAHLLGRLRHIQWRLMQDDTFPCVEH